MKKGQITIVIILGILLLISSMIIVYIRSTSESEGYPYTETSEKPSIFEKGMNECLKALARDGLRVIGYNGGYYNSTLYGLMHTPGQPTESDILYLKEGNPIRPAYWWYFKSDNSCKKDCECSSNKPALYGSSSGPSIESEVSAYIMDNMHQCTGFLEPVEMQGYSISKESSPRINTMVLEGGIIVELEQKYLIEKKEDKFTYDKFRVSVPVKLKKMYEMADKIVKAQRNSSFIENYVKNLIGIYSMPAPSADRLPPISASTMGPQSPVVWQRSEVEKALQNVLASYVPMFQALGTRNFEFRNIENNPTARGIYNLPTFFLNSSYRDLDIDFKYLDWWEIYLDINGRGAKGELIMPEMSTTPLPFLMFQRYNYYYDVSFPVLIQIKDPAAFKREGYSFFVALEANIRANKPLNCSEPAELGTSPYVGPMLCKDEHRVTGEYNITFNNRFSNDSMSDIILNYACGTTACMIDFIPSVADNYTLQTRLPSSCRNGKMNAQALDYRSEPVTVSTSYNSTGNLTLNLVEKRTINVTVKKKQMVKGMANWSFRNSPTFLLKSEKALVQITEVNPASEPYSTGFFFTGNDTKKEIDLYPGKYKVDISVLYELPNVYGQESIVIPPIDRCEGGGMFTDCEEIHIDGMSFNKNFLSGGLLLDSENASNRYFTIRPEQLYDSDRLIIYTLDYFGQALVNNELTYDDLDRLSEREKMSMRYGNQLRPEFVNDSKII